MRLKNKLTLLLIIFFWVTPVFAANLFDDYDKRMEITIDETKIDTADLTHFPVTVIIDSGETGFWTVP